MLKRRHVKKLKNAAISLLREHFSERNRLVQNSTAVVEVQLAMFRDVRAYLCPECAYKHLHSPPHCQLLVSKLFAYLTLLSRIYI